MQIGVVEWSNATKGFGFIQPGGGGQDVFLHISAIERARIRGLAEREEIGYELLPDRHTGKFLADQLRLQN
jgi:CspA family cold shock protein